MLICHLDRKYFYLLFYVDLSFWLKVFLFAVLCWFVILTESISTYCSMLICHLDRKYLYFLSYVNLSFRLKVFLQKCLLSYVDLWSPAGKGLTSWLSFVVSYCEFVTFSLVSWVRCGTRLYRFLIFAPLLTLSFRQKEFISEIHAILSWLLTHYTLPYRYITA